MIVKTEKLKALLKKKNLTPQQFAGLLRVEVSEVDKMLEGQAVGYDTAKRFIYFLKAGKAQHYIDWKAIGKENPLRKHDGAPYQDDNCIDGKEED